MSDVDECIAAGLDRLVPLPSGEPADWHDVLRRSGAKPQRRRRVALALTGLAAGAVLAVATPVGTAIAQGIEDFSAWLTGHPGTQASPSEQRAFDAANGRSWASFPTGTKLRELITTDVGGKGYVLSGFRSGTSLCLRLTGPDRRDQRVEPACVPTSAVMRAKAPVAVVSGNGSFFDQYSHVSAQYSFGIAADGVDRVDVHAVDGDHRALLGGNSYLWIEREPNTGNRVERISVTAGGRSTNVDVEGHPLMLGLPASSREPGGPTRVEATLAHPTIGWYVRHEKRGLTPAQAGIAPLNAPAFPCCSDARLFKPDPSSNIVVGLAGGWCVVVNHGVGCSDESHFFDRGPLNFSMFGASASDQSLAVAGAAADGVTRIDLFLAGGGRQAVPLEDNMFATLVPNRFPIKLVAYDARARVVGIETFPPHAFTAHATVPASAKRNLRPVLDVRGPNGTTAIVSVGRVVNRQRCWRVDDSTGRSESGCDLTFYTGPKITVNLVQPAGRDLFVIGGVDAKVTDRVELHFDNGDVLTARPVANRYAFAIPRAHLSAQRRFAYVVAIDHHGHRVQRQGLGFRTS